MTGLPAQPSQMLHVLVWELRRPLLVRRCIRHGLGLASAKDLCLCRGEVAVAASLQRLLWTCVCLCVGTRRRGRRQETVSRLGGSLSCVVQSRRGKASLVCGERGAEREKKNWR